MTVVYPVSLINERLGNVLSAIDDGPSSGFLQLLDSGGNVLSSLQLASPAASITSGVMTFQGMSLIDPSAARSGTAVGAQIIDSLSNIWVSGLTVGQASPGASFDILLTPTNVIVAGQTIALTAATITGH